MVLGSKGSYSPFQSHHHLKINSHVHAKKKHITQKDQCVEHGFSIFPLNPTCSIEPFGKKHHYNVTWNMPHLLLNLWNLIEMDDKNPFVLHLWNNKEMKTLTWSRQLIN